MQQFALYIWDPLDDQMPGGWLASQSGDGSFIELSHLHLESKHTKKGLGGLLQVVSKSLW